MPRFIESHVDTGSAQFTDNAERMRALVEDLNETVARISEGGGAARVQRHRDRGKMTARERIDALVDPGTAFLELSQLAALGVYDDDVPAAGIITGVGRVSGVV